MKVTLADFEIHLGAFMKKVASAMPSPLYKFAVGAFTAANAGRIESLLAGVTDAEGMIDLDEARRLTDAGFAASGDDLVINLPGVPLLGMQSVAFKLTKADVNEFFAGFTPQKGDL